LSDVFGISVGALQAFQSAIDVTSNNIANANTPGYVKESVNLTAAAPESNGVLSVGNGVVVSGISRSFNQATANQLNASQSSLGNLNALQNYSSQIDNLVGTTAGGLSTTLQNFYSAWSDVANNPTSTATRQALLGKAQSVAASFQSTGSQLDALNSDINSRITSDVQQINTLGTSISVLNKQIVISTAQNGGQPPNELIDQRDQLVSNLSSLTGISTTTDSNGSLNVFLGNGQPLVLQGATTTLTTIPNQFDASQLEVSTSTSNGNPISSAIASGDLGGLLAARSQIVDPAKNQLGQIATAFAQTVNQQQNAGLDLTGNLGANLFSVGAPLANASSKNTDGITASAKVTNTGALTTNDYVLSYTGGAYSLTNAATGTAVPFTGQIAAAGAVQANPASGNTGTATISSGTVVDATNPNLLNTATITFATPPTSYTINGGASIAYSAGGTIPPAVSTPQYGWQVQISGTPAAGDSFTVQKNSGGTGDNRNALLGASQQSLPVLQNGTVSVSGAVSSLITGIGSQAQQINTAQTAQSAVNTQAVTNQQSISGVNLDEEAANLLQWQQAYQASAKALQIGSSLFQSLLTAVQAA
jgi:flagellar hook-associated protein 1 FlgK